MKKIYFATLALAMTACVSNEDLNPVDNYGYIDVNVSNDPVMVTRGEQSVNDLTGWTIKTQLGESAAEDWTSTKPYKAGTYKVIAQSHENETAWQSANSSWGAAYYEGTDNEVIVSAGQTGAAEISCGNAQNARLKVEFSLVSNFTEYSLKAERDLVFNASNSETALAYYAATEEVDYTFSYKYNGTPKAKAGKITMKGAATENIISISSNDNGKISITISYNDTFGKGNSETLTFDAATGTIEETPNAQQ